MYNSKKSASLNKYNIQLVNEAISCSKLQVNFEIDNIKLVSKVTDLSRNGFQCLRQHSKILWPYITLAILVSDIEGSEIEIIMVEKNEAVISKCQQIIIELHEVEYSARSYK